MKRSKCEGIYYFAIAMLFCGFAVAQTDSTPISRIKELNLRGQELIDELKYHEFEKLRLKLEISGKWHHDYGWFDPDEGFQDQFGDPSFNEIVRRGRITFDMEYRDDVFMRAEFDVSGSEREAKDVYIGIRELSVVGTVMTGHFREPFGLETLTSGNYITFMERSLVRALMPLRNLGFMATNAIMEDRVTWAAGIFRDSDEFNYDETSELENLTGRITWLPWYADEGKSLIHLGAAYSYRRPGGDFSFRTRPETRLVSWFTVETPLIHSDNAQMMGLEFAMVEQHLSFQAEYYQATMDASSGVDYTFNGYYAYASYILTKEHRRYLMEKGVFGPIIPKNNFTFRNRKGWGAWELGLRYSYIDLNDQDVFGGEETNITFGVNWYINHKTRVMLNFINADIENLAGDAELNIIQTRIQLAF